VSSRYPQSPASQEPDGWHDPDAPYARDGAEPVHPEPVEQFFASQDVTRRSRARRTLATDGRRWTCMGPLMISEIRRLRRQGAP